MSAHLVDLPFKLIFATWTTLILRKLASGSLPSLVKLLSSNTVVQIACFSLLMRIVVNNLILPTPSMVRALHHSHLSRTPRDSQLGVRWHKHRLPPTAYKARRLLRYEHQTM